MVYSAGTGSLLETAAQDAVSLRSGNRRGKQGRQRADQNGEIFETVLNDNYIAWLDTDQKGSNRIYVLNRSEDAKPRLIKECAYAVPRLLRRTICCGSSRTRKRKSGSTSSI